MNPTPDLHLSLHVTLRASGQTPNHAEEALDRLARVLYGMNAQEGVIQPVRPANTPLTFLLSAPLNADNGGAIGALQLVQMVALHMSTALSRHYGETIGFQGEVRTGAVMHGMLVDQPVSLGPIEGQHYTIVDSVVQRANGEVAFPAVVDGVLNRPAASIAEAGMVTDAFEPDTTAARPRLRR